MKLRIVALPLCLSACAWAGTACQQGTLANLLAQGECSIGSLDFNFLTSNYIHGLTGAQPASASGVGFIPVTAPGLQGFLMTGPFAYSGVEGVANSSYGRVTFNVKGSTSLEVIALFGELGASVHPDSTCARGFYCYTDTGALAGAGLLGGNSSSTAYSVSALAGQSPSTYSNPGDWVATGPFTGSSTWVAHAGIDMQINPQGLAGDASASVYLSSAAFWFREPQSEAPEPATWALMGITCVPLYWLRRRRGAAAFGTPAISSGPRPGARFQSM